jgi:FkbH-like protein
MLENLGWLLPPPVDFRDRIKTVRQAITNGELEGIEARLQALANYGLGPTQLDQLAKCVRGYLEVTRHTKLRRIKLGLLGAGTLDVIGPALAATGLRHNLLIDVVKGDYGTMLQSACDPDSAFRSQNPEFVLVAGDYRSLDLERFSATEAEARNNVDFAAGTLRTVLDGLKSWVSGGVLMQTIVPPLEPLFGSLDFFQMQSAYAAVDAVNRRIGQWALAGEATLVDIARGASWVGLEQWHDPGRWHLAKMPFAIRFTPLYADLIMRVLSGVAGHARKCLVLDLDNTLWGGVIGDDGVEGIVLGQGSAGGEAFLEMQRTAKRLRQRGVILAVCSKNEQDAALKPFREHPEMVLSESDIAVFHANWTDKASNLRTIAQTLQIGLDALVFVDDNPVEREQVRRELPMVAVPELPEDPAFYTRTFMAAGWFEAVTFVEEDARRADDYTAQVQRREMESSSDVAGYLQSLEMVCSMKSFDPVGRARIAQLINKSNQFNLTTRRYSETQVGAVESDPELFTLQVRLKDRFGDSGMISVIIFRREGARWVNDTWLMSCRVLGRRVEEAVLAEVARVARQEGAVELIGSYLPTEKNRMVEKHYEKLGFSLVEANDKATIWRLDLQTYNEPELPLQIQR